MNQATSRGPFAAAFANFMFLQYYLLILKIFDIFHYSYIYYSGLWLMNLTLTLLL